MNASLGVIRLGGNRKLKYFKIHFLYPPNTRKMNIFFFNNITEKV